ncbi:FAD-dependent oxidoreductase [Geoglobus acetivorans]|uniref:FAD-dependent oxidoreductase n=1 Tax=Geoglobus acetivorans TaxID=565033 RepID=A0ABZ3H3I1_GEOAI|nr:FAD-dependent oxidoreductase [Geoglobus acetivorans]
MRLESHPIVDFKRGKEVTIYFNGKPVKAYEGESVAAALYAAGVRVFSRSFRFHRPRGFFCAIGKCSQCMMEVNGVPNVRTCKIYVKDGMQIRTQNSIPDAENDALAIFDKIIDTVFPHGSHYKKFNRSAKLREFATKQMRKLAGFGNPPKSVPDVDAEYEIIETDVAVIGGGPGGMSAAIHAGKYGARVIVMDENPFLGGQLVKQTHRFFGSAKERAGTRGIKIAKILEEELLSYDNVEVRKETKVFGVYGNEVAAVEKDRKLLRVKAKKIVIATGAYERTLIFENNDLPGVYGAGGVQTLMNVYGIKPGERGLIIGSGNVGLILTYQLLQAGVDVAAIVEAMPRVGGYFVHAAKVRRLGVPIYTRHTIVRAVGNKRVEGAVVAQLDDRWQPVPGTEKKFDVDFICVAVGLSPAHELLYHVKAQMKFVPELGGLVPLRTKYNETSVEGIYVAGDVAGIEEATAAIMEGRIAGLHAAMSLGYGGEDVKKELEEAVKDIEAFRAGPFGERICHGLEKCTLEKEVSL